MKIVLLSGTFYLMFISFSIAGPVAKPTERFWVDSVYRSMSDLERIGQLINLKVNVTDRTLKAYRNTILKYGIGQITLTGGTPEAYGDLINELSQHLKVPLLITTIGYPGVGVPLDSAFHFPGIASMDRVDDRSLIRALAGEVESQAGRLQVREYRTGLLNIDISAFDMTLHGGALNHYGPLPDWSLAFHRGISDRGMMINAEIRILGSGSPDVIAGKLLNQPVFAGVKMKRRLGVKNFDRWYFTIARIPFFNLSDVERVKTGLTDGIIRRKFGNRAMITADIEALFMNRSWKRARAPAITLLLSGMDVIEVPDHPERVIEQIQNALAGQALKTRDLEEKVKRILRVKYLAGVEKSFKVNRDHLHEDLNRPEAKLVALKVFKKAVSMRDGRLLHIPLDELGGHYFASLTFGGGHLNEFRKTLDAYAPFVHFFLPSLSCDPGSVKDLRRRLKTFDRVVVGLHTRDLLEVGENIVDFINQLSLQTKLILVFFEDIRNENDFSDRAAKVFVHEDHPYVQNLAAQIIFGGYLAPGSEKQPGKSCLRLGFGLPEEEQMDTRTLSRINRMVKEAIRDEDMPGCQVLVARNGKVVYDKSFGYYTYDSLMRVSENSIYDLASITKVASTTQMMMWLWGRGLIDLDKSVGDYLPELAATNKEDLIIRDILLHQAGLKPFYPFWRFTVADGKPDSAYYHSTCQSPADLVVAPGMCASKSLRDSVWHWTIETELLHKNKSGTYDYEYSDLGFYILQKLIERVTDKPLDVLVDSLFYKPMGMGTMSYLPLCHFPRRLIVPTEKDTYFRHSLVWGTVHDPIAAMVGGVAGHAGLFSNADDLAKLMQMNLNHGTYGGRSYLQDSVIEQFISRQNKKNRRSLGWDKPESEKGYNPVSRYASWKTFGHRGFTGTAVWADPTFQLIYVFLSNRVYKDRVKKRAPNLNVRKRVHEVIYESMWNYQKVHNH